jgi:hypothetical protein
MKSSISGRPRSGRIPDAINYSGLGRTRLYEEAARRPGLFRKAGAVTLVDFNVLDQVIDELPDAEINPAYGQRRPRAAPAATSTI